MSSVKTTRRILAFPGGRLRIAVPVISCSRLSTRVSGSRLPYIQKVRQRAERIRGMSCPSDLQFRSSMLAASASGFDSWRTGFFPEVADEIVLLRFGAIKWTPAIQIASAQTRDAVRDFRLNQSFSSGGREGSRTLLSPSLDCFDDFEGAVETELGICSFVFPASNRSRLSSSHTKRDPVLPPPWDLPIKRSNEADSGRHSLNSCRSRSFGVGFAPDATR